MLGLGPGPANFTRARLRASQAAAVSNLPAALLVPSLDLPGPGHALAARAVQQTTAGTIPPALVKACYVYIYIALKLTEVSSGLYFSEVSRKD